MNRADRTSAVGVSAYVVKWYPVPSPNASVITATSIRDAITCPTPARSSRRREPADPENEHRDHRQERKPVRLRPPDQPPERRRLPEVERAENQRDVDAEREPREVEDDQRDDVASRRASATIDLPEKR